MTGSTLKAVPLAAALDARVLSPSERIDCENGQTTYGGKVMHDPNAFGTLGVAEVLAVARP